MGVNCTKFARDNCFDMQPDSMLQPMPLSRQGPEFEMDYEENFRDLSRQSGLQNKQRPDANKFEKHILSNKVDKSKPHYQKYLEENYHVQDIRYCQNIRIDSSSQSQITPRLSEVQPQKDQKTQKGPQKQQQHEKINKVVNNIREDKSEYQSEIHHVNTFNNDQNSADHSSIMSVIEGDDYRSDIKILIQEIESTSSNQQYSSSSLQNNTIKRFSQPTSINHTLLASPSLQLPNSSGLQRKSTLELAIPQIIKQFHFFQDEDFCDFLELQVEPGINVSETQVRQPLFESKIFRKPHNSETFIERTLRLDQLSITCYTLHSNRLLFQIPIQNVKSIEIIPVEEPIIQQPVPSKRRHRKHLQLPAPKPQKFFFKIVLDYPLNQTQTSRRTYVSQRYVPDESEDLFGIAGLEKIDQDKNSDMFDSVILNNEEDNQSVIFEDENSSVLKNSHSNRVYTNKKGHNSKKTDYYEVFDIGCEDEVTCKKWVLLIKWLLKKHLLATN